MQGEMSEIFNWLKRAEMEKRKAFIEVSPQPVVELHPRTNGDKETSITNVSDELMPEHSNLPPIIMESREIEKLDLDRAEYHIKSVLDPVTLVGEQFRVLRAKITQLQKQRGVKTLLITSATPGEGKTFTACGLAGVLAQEPGKRVLLVDGDLRKPRVGPDLGMTNHRTMQGFSAVLREEVGIMDALLPTTNPSLFLLPAGKTPTNPAELLSSPMLERSVKTASKFFDWVLIDSPPVIALADPSVIAPICDSILLVIYTNQTPAKLIKESVQRIGRERICGIVMNRVLHDKSSRYYKKYYHHYSNGTSR
jgi:capsular exopolysaccharide synthesis family protein